MIAMNRYHTATLAKIFIVLLSCTTLIRAQERDKSANEGELLPRISGQQQWHPEQVRAELLSLSDEADATFTFVRDFSVVRQIFANSGRDGLEEAILNNRESRARIAGMSATEMAAYSVAFPEGGSLRRLKSIIRRMRNNPSYLRALNRAEGWFNDSNTAVAAIDRSRESEGRLSSKERVEFTKDSCDWKSLTDFPSAADVAIANGVLIAIQAVLQGLDETAGTTSAPNPAYYIALAAKTIDGAVLTALEIKRENGTWCQDMAFNIQGGLVADSGFLLHTVFTEGNGYAERVKSLVTALYEQAKAKGLDVPCVAATLAKADQFYASRDWLEAYKKYREAYQFISADPPDTCPVP